MRYIFVFLVLGFFSTGWAAETVLEKAVREAREKQRDDERKAATNAEAQLNARVMDQASWAQEKVQADVEKLIGQNASIAEINPKLAGADHIGVGTREFYPTSYKYKYIEFTVILKTTDARLCQLSSVALFRAKDSVSGSKAGNFDSVGYFTHGDYFDCIRDGAIVDGDDIKSLFDESAVSIAF